ncbi:hypothetical protein CBF16_07915 [Pantoea agglomerans]|uniref:hypothetical protein n=1 Tax=Enterobacter agglomerans TaxID=549 RepID=UPI000F5F580A|nr:hypothetical protein [Pantoea agglomerans]AZI50783.1 hypothetical protein CBF16_07915 [Pantoea agglomerans]
MVMPIPGGGGITPAFSPGRPLPGNLPLSTPLPGSAFPVPGSDLPISYSGGSGTPLAGLSDPIRELDQLLTQAGLGALVDPAAAEEGTVPTALFTSETSGEDIPQAPGDGMRTSEKDIRVRLTEENLKGRPPGDNRSAEQIIDENPVLKNLGNQKDIKQAELKERFGDWTDANKDPKSRADAAYNMACVLNSIKGLNARDGSERKEISANDKIEGITKDGDARHGTEAGVLKDIAEQGLKMLPENKQLPETNDSHVRMDGTNKDNFQWGMGEFGKILSNIPILKSVAAPFFNNIGEARNVGEVFTGGLKGLAEGGMSAARGPIGWGITAATDTVQIAVENSGGKGKNEPPPFA